MSRPLVGTPLAGCCTVLSVFGAIFLALIGLCFQRNVEVLTGSTKSPHDTAAVAKNCYIAALVYVAFIVFCSCQVGVNRRYSRGAVRI